MHEAILRREKKTFFKGSVRTPFHPIHRFVESHSVPFPRPRPSPILSLSTCSHCLFSGASDNPARIRENYSACLRTGKWKLSSVTYDDPFETPLIASRRIVCSRDSWRVMARSFSCPLPPAPPTLRRKTFVHPPRDFNYSNNSQWSSLAPLWYSSYSRFSFHFVHFI